jgi:imidazoleglycerol phosphate synthase glutamine amidotransferase subunit HisH
MAIAILDYGSGNLRSALRAFERAGKEVVLTSDYSVALEAEGLVVPGVGAFAACMTGKNNSRPPHNWNLCGNANSLCSRC